MRFNSLRLGRLWRRPKSGSNRAFQAATIHSRLDRIIEWLLVGLLVFMPLTFGAVEPWSELVVFAVATAMSVCLGLRCLIPGGARFVWTWNYVPLALFALLAAMQLVPLPDALVRQISPQTVATKASLLADVPEASTGRTALSFYAYATRHDLRLALVAACVFVVVVNVFRHREEVKRLLLTIVLIGSGFVVLALAQDISGAAQIYWTVEIPANEANSGSFVNHSHYAQFMNLSIGAALALLLIRFEEMRRRQGSGGSRRLAAKLLRSPMIIWLAAMILLGGLTIFLSLSRNGVISLVAAAGFTGLALAVKSKLKLRGWFLLVLPLAVLAGLLFSGFDAVYERMATLQQMQDDARWKMALGALNAWRQYPLWGAGLGTHEVVFPAFDPDINADLAGHADCDYVQLLEETGVAGITLIAAFLLGFWCRYALLIRKRFRSISMAAFGLGFGLLAVMIHSATDFGQHLPANFCLTAIVCGLLVSIGRIERRYATTAPGSTLRRPTHAEVAAMPPRAREGLSFKPYASQPTAARWMRWFVGAAALAGLAAIWGWVLYDANAARIGEMYWSQAVMGDSRVQQWNWQAADEDYKRLIADAAAAAAAEPDKVKPRYWLNIYRWHSITRVVDATTGHVVWHPEYQRFASRIADELARARVLCPTFGPLYSFEGRLRLLYLGQDRGADLIRKGYALVPNDASTCFLAGVLAAREGKLDEATARFKRAIALHDTTYSTDSFFTEIVHIYVDELKRPDLVCDLVEQHLLDGTTPAEEETGRESPKEKMLREAFFKRRCRQRLTIIEILSPAKETASLAAQIRDETAAVLSRRAKSDDVTSDELAALAEICHTDGQYGEAADYYRRALGFDFTQVQWRMGLAQCLVDMGDFKEAMHQARICLRLYPGLPSVVEFIKQLSLRAPLGFDAD